MPEKKKLRKMSELEIKEKLIAGISGKMSKADGHILKLTERLNKAKADKDKEKEKHYKKLIKAHENRKENLSKKDVDVLAKEKFDKFHL